MTPEIYWISGVEKGRLGIMARPRGGEWLEDEISSMSKAGVTHVVSLLEAAEIYELGLREEKNCCLQNAIEFLHFPIPDRGIPNDREGKEFCEKLQSLCASGDSLVVHCRAGIGRSGMICAGVLCVDGSRPQDALRVVSSSRGVEVPDTDDQVNWLMRCFG